MPKKKATSTTPIDEAAKRIYGWAGTCEVKYPSFIKPDIAAGLKHNPEPPLAIAISNFGSLLIFDFGKPNTMAVLLARPEHDRFCLEVYAWSYKYAWYDGRWVQEMELSEVIEKAQKLFMRRAA